MQGKYSRIVIVGYMFTGKTSIARRTAKKLGMRFFDVDTEVETKYHYSVYDIFKKFGENVFRKMERQMLEQLLQTDNAIIATGGGTPCFEDNMQLIKQKSFSIYIDMDPKQIISRQKTSKVKRPLLDGMTQEEKERFMLAQIEQRKPFYMQADAVLPHGDDISERIVQLIEQENKSGVK
ncbi:MAG: shikimate kinase [Bacteroidales bacterium]|nr:shikimate kinase [Bacteroidales bacterium]